MCVWGGGGVCVVWAAWVGAGAETEAERHSQAKDNAVCVCVCVCMCVSRSVVSDSLQPHQL